ncbi:MAG: imelysin family protein, partial [Pricia sp.]
MRRLFGALLVVTLLWACSSDDSGVVDNPPAEGENPGTPNGETGFERGALLANWADNIIVPSYEAFTAEVASMKTAFDAFKADASEANLVALRVSWLSAYRTWQKVSMFEIGPAETVGLRLNINIYPTDTEKIAGYLASGSYDLSLPSNRDAKGFPALDYLINGLGEDDPSIVSKFNEPGKDALIGYIDDVLADMTGLSDQVLSEWKQGYRDTFVNADGSSATASVDRFTNDFVFYYEKFLRAGKMGIPLGVFSGVQ